MKTKILLITIFTLIISSSLIAQVTRTITDWRDQKTYKTVQIGTQTWMAENLNFETSSGSWVYKNDSSNASIYGRLYYWETANQACPPGWHLPSEEEWMELRDFLGGKKIAGGKLKEAGSSHWESPNTGATNETGFSALPGGLRNQNKGFHYMGRHGQWWTSTYKDYGRPGIRYMGLSRKSSKLTMYFGAAMFFKVGLSVRCVRD